MAIKSKIATFYYQVYSPTLKVPVYLPTLQEHEAIHKIEDLVENEGWKEHSLCIGTFFKRDTIHRNFKLGRTYNKITTVLSPTQKRKMRKLRRKLFRDEKNHTQDQIDFLVNFIIGYKSFEIKGEGFEGEFQKTLTFLRKKGYPEATINRMVGKASNKYRFGFEVSRLNRKAVIVKDKETGEIVPAVL